MKNFLFLVIALWCGTFSAVAQTGVQINSATQLFAGGHLRIDAQPLTFFSGHILTPRDKPENSVYFIDGTTIAGEKDASYINGYATKSGMQSFKFPVGSQNGNDVRTIEILGTKNAAEISVAYWEGDVGTNLDPTGGAHDRNAISPAGNGGVDKIVSISNIGFWDWIPVSGSGEVGVKVSIPENIWPDGYAASSIRLVGWNTATQQWDNLSGDTAPASNAEGAIVSGTVSNLTLYSAITIGGTAMPLPVKLISFTVSKENTQVNLVWETSEEVNAGYFEVQRSQNATDWMAVGTRQAAGESKSKLTYSLADAAPLNGNNYYRLKMVDKDETFAFSKVHNVHFGANENFLTIYPNPVSNVLNIKSPDLLKTNQIMIRSVSGKTVHEAQNISHAGIDVSRLANGLYLVTVVFEDGSRQTQKISVVH